MFCNRCGAQIDDNARFCNACGAQVEQSQPIINQNINNQPMPQANYYQNPTLPEKPKKNKLIPIIIAVVAALIILVVVIFALSGSGKSNDEAVDGSSSSNSVSTEFNDNGGSSSSSSEKVELYSNEPFDEGNTTDQEGTIIGEYDNPKVYNDTSIIINNKEITLPISLKEFSEQTGFTYEFPANQLQESSFNIVDVEKGDENLSVTVANKDSSPKAYEDCMVYSVRAYADYLSKTTVSLPCGASLGQRANLNGVINALGNPSYYQNYTTNEPKQVSISYSSGDYDDFEIYITDDKITELELHLSFYR